MEFSERDRKLFLTLVKEPVALWISIPCFIVAYILFLAVKNYSGWTWFAELHVELPAVLLFIYIASQQRITSDHRELLQKLASSHPELNGDIQNPTQAGGL
jgi:hypothetical protein